MKWINIILIGMVIGVCVGCRPYAKPDVEEVPNNVTAFLIPLEGDSGQQAKFSSVDYLNQSKVATKRVIIQKRWIKTGYSWLSGRYVPTHRLVKVNRTPVAKRWTPEKDTGTAAENQGLSAESRDSIGVTSGFAITAYVTEEDTATFLYFFPDNSLSDVINNQIFNAAQAVYTEWAAKKNLEELRGAKEEITDAMRKELIPKFKKMGITIDETMGLIGGLYYENAQIQDAIDNVFIAQTLKEKRIAEKAAQVTENERMLSIEQTEAQKRKVKADAEAYEIAAKAKAIREGGPEYLKIKELEVLAKGIDKWGGNIPTTLVAGSGGNILSHLMLNKAEQ